MTWNPLTSTLLGAFISYSAILLTQVIDLWKRKRSQEALIEALLHAVQEEVESLLEMASVNAPPVDKGSEEKPYEHLFTAKQDYFTIYHANPELVMQIKQPELRRSIFTTYLRAKGLLDTVSMNRLYLERYHYLQSTFLKTRDPIAQTASENYRQMLIQIAGQLRKADADFRKSATNLLELISAQLKPRSTLDAKAARTFALQKLRLPKLTKIYGTPQ
ncbi:MAG: hypothetical protein SFY81_01390 [Verrucomicrobiota bacterium]|nr:hypothetical protein [Verrucomicrobiota bacterium]